VVLGEVYPKAVVENEEECEDDFGYDDPWRELRVSSVV